MGRARRIHFAGAVYHAMARGNGGKPIFQSDEDCRIFLGILEEVARKTGCAVMAYCLMANHFHLLIQVAAISLSVVMSRVLSRYAKYFNSANNRRGHVFQSRFLAKLCLDERYLLAVFRYIHRNPVKAGLVRAPGDWPWSSHRQYKGPIHSTLIAVERGLGLLASEPGLALRRYAALMEEGIDDFTPSFDAEESSLAHAPPPAAPPSLEVIAAELRRESGIDFTALSGRHRNRAVSGMRREFARRAAAVGYRNSAIANALRVHPTTVGDYLGL